MTKRYGFWTLTFLVIANMIGAGVFTTSGYSMQYLGAPGVVVLAWGVGGLIAITGACSYGFLIKAMPESGGEYLFLSRAAHPLLGFIAGWVSLIAGFSGAIAFAATALEAYVLPAETRPEWLPAGTLAVLSILLAGIFHGKNPRLGALVQNSVVLIKLGLLAAILLFAALKFSTVEMPGVSAPTTDLTGWALISAFAGSLVWISLSYSGFNAAVYVADEVENAERTIPRSMVVGTILVMALYLLLNAVFVYAPAPEAIKGQADVATIAAEFIGGEWFAGFVRWTIVTCLLTSVFSMIMTAPRVYAKMAEDGLLPGFIRMRGDSPGRAILVQVGLAILLVLISSLQGLLSYLGLTLSISAAGSVFCLFLPGVRTKPMSHYTNVIPMLFIISTLVAAGLLISFKPWQLMGTAVTFAIGVAAYLLTRIFNPKSVSLNPSEKNRSVETESIQQQRDSQS
ncbi:Serine/threonine exchanger SteT [Gimesia panareensis]|uniref:Serine/threonine exchanger SteT n=1 Tax=Gimesia panareensis TaxID=2527978 RepID=A0A518FI05_9PLAN|nr:amino acid permease [Gimesia panareensis]QDV15987.1 Serine/threonine exchanger SteT [Gimesia panareensis]